MEVFCPWIIKRQAAEQKITQQQLADILQVDRGTIDRWLNGRTSIPVDTVPHIAKALSCKVVDFFDEVPDAAGE